MSEQWHRLTQFEPLPGGVELVSPSGRHVLRYDVDGVPVIVDLQTQQVRWRAGDEGAPSTGVLMLQYAVEVRRPGGGPNSPALWTSSVASPGARFLTVTDDGDLELLDERGVSLFNSRLGFIGPQPTFRGSAPAASITVKRYLYHKRVAGLEKRTVRRELDGSLRVGELWGHYFLPAPLAMWMEQDDTVLTWQKVPTAQGTDLELCLVDDDGKLLWRHSAADASTTPPPAVAHDYGGSTMGVGARLRRQSLTSPSGSHTLLHHKDGNVVLYCNASHTSVWSSGTNWIGDSWLDLTRHGDLVLRTSCGAPVWRTDTAGQGIRQLTVRDDGGLALLDITGTRVWQVDPHAPCAAAGRPAPRGAVLRRGETLRNQSLTSPDGGTVLCHEPESGVRLFRADGIQVWSNYESRTEAAHLSLDHDGYLRLRDDEGVLSDIAGPGDHLAVVPGGEIRLRDPDGAVVWRGGQHVIDSNEDILSAAARPLAPVVLETLLNAVSTPIVRTTFLDGQAWDIAWRDISQPREYHDDTFTLDVALIASPEFDGWTSIELARLLATSNHRRLLVIDAVTLDSPEHPVLIVEIDPERDQPRTLRATPHALLDVEIQLSTANMDWEDFSDSADPDGILRTSFAD